MHEEKEAVLKAIAEELQTLPLEDQLEVLANTFIRMGFFYMEGTPTQAVTPEVVMELIMSDKAQNGETLGNALALQGITILSWLQNER